MTPKAVLPYSQYRFLLTFHDWIYIPHPKPSRYRVFLWDYFPASSEVVSSDKSQHYPRWLGAHLSKSTDKSALLYIPNPDALPEMIKYQILFSSEQSNWHQCVPVCCLNQSVFFQIWKLHHPCLAVLIPCLLHCPQPFHHTSLIKEMQHDYRNDCR